MSLILHKRTLSRYISIVRQIFSWNIYIWRTNVQTYSLSKFPSIPMATYRFNALPTQLSYYKENVILLACKLNYLFKSHNDLNIIKLNKAVLNSWAALSPLEYTTSLWRAMPLWAAMGTVIKYSIIYLV